MERYAISPTQVLTPTGSYDLVAVVGTRVIPRRGRADVVVLGLTVLLGIVAYSMLGEPRGDDLLKVVAVFGLPAFALILYGMNSNRRHDVAIVVPSGEALVTTVKALAEAHKVQLAIEEARGRVRAA